jgi:hypothetical protein
MGDVFATGKHCLEVAGVEKATEEEASKSPGTNSLAKGEASNLPPTGGAGERRRAEAGAVAETEESTRGAGPGSLKKRDISGGTTTRSGETCSETTGTSRSSYGL